MRTHAIAEVSIVVLIIFTPIITACTPPRTAPQQTAAAVMAQAQEAIDGRAAAAALLGAQTIEAALPELIAIENNLAGAKGAWMFLDSCNKIAVFVTAAGRSASGAMIYFLGTVDVKAGKLVDSANVLAEYGIDFRRINTFEDIETALRSRGFERMAPAAVPTLYATLNMALSFIKSLGGSAIEVLIMPAGMLTPEMISPWCKHNCEGIQL